MTRDQIVLKLTEKYEEMYGCNLKMDESFADNGLDSLDSVEFLLEVETSFEISISDTILAELKTPNDLVNVIIGHLQPRR